jgi:hypothetical protein
MHSCPTRIDDSCIIGTTDVMCQQKQKKDESTYMDCRRGNVLGKVQPSEQVRLTNGPQEHQTERVIHSIVIAGGREWRKFSWKILLILAAVFVVGSKLRQDERHYPRTLWLGDGISTEAEPGSVYIPGKNK